MTWKIGAIVEPSTRSLLVALPADQGQNLRAYFLYKLGMYLGQHYQATDISFSFRNKGSQYIGPQNIPNIWQEEMGIGIVPSHNNVHIAECGYRNPSESYAIVWLQEAAREITDFVVIRIPPPETTEVQEPPTQEEPVVEEPSVPEVPEGVGDTNWEVEPELPDHVWNNDAIRRE